MTIATLWLTFVAIDSFNRSVNAALGSGGFN